MLRRFRCVQIFLQTCVEIFLERAAFYDTICYMNKRDVIVIFLVTVRQISIHIDSHAPDWPGTV